MHKSVRVYPNGEMKTNAVRDEDLESHIDYNKNFRFGCSLFIDDKLVYAGYLGEEGSLKYLEQVKNTEVYLGKPTIPYR